MIFRLIHHSKFWLKFSAYGAGIGAIALFGAYLSLYRATTPEKLQQAAVKALAGTGRTVTFAGGDISRTLFPRPTITVRNVRLSRPGSRETALSVREWSTGIAWQTLFGANLLEKVVLDGADAEINCDSSGKCSLDDLWRREQNGWQINRLIVRNSRADINTAGETWQMENMDAAAGVEEGGFAYRLNADIRHPLLDNLRVDLSGRGSRQPDGSFKLPENVLNYQGVENGYAFSGSLSGGAIWKNGVFNAEKATLKADSKRWETHLNMTIAALRAGGGKINGKGLNGVFTAGEGLTRYDGTLTLAHADWQAGIWNSDDAAFSISGKSGGAAHTDFNLNTKVQWRFGRELQLPEFKASTYQQAPDGTSRLISEWEGSLNFNRAQNWQIHAKGLFERQPAEVALQREQNEISGQIRLAKLNIGKYAGQEIGGSSLYPDWFGKQMRLKLDLDLGALELPTLQIQNIRTTLNADRSRAVFAPFAADLYSGRTEGSLSVEYGGKPQYRLRQKARDVQVLPLLQDLFAYAAISGQGDVDLDIGATGTSRDEWMQTVGGSLKLDVKHGSWLDIDFLELLQGNPLLPKTEKAEKKHTLFDRFILDSRIENGISSHTVSGRMAVPPLSINGSGQTNLVGGDINESLQVRAGSTPPLPLKLSGKLDNPSISLDYAKLTSGLNTPDQKQQALRDRLAQQWQWVKKQAAPKAR